MDLAILAQGIDPASATAWATGSAAGLLGLVLFWLAYSHLPGKDKQITDIVTVYNARTDAKDAQIMLLVNTTISVGDIQRKDFTVALDKVVVHCAEENAKARDSWERKVRVAISEEAAKTLERIGRRKPLGNGDDT